MTEFSDRDIALMPSWTELREAKGISLADIAQRTNIRESKLKAIESHDFAALGTETFALGYIRLYAKALGEDSDVFVQVYKDAVVSGFPVKDEGQKAESTGGKGVDYENTPSALLIAVRKINVLYLSVGVIVVWILAMIILPGGEQDETGASVGEPSMQADVPAIEQRDTGSGQAPDSANLDVSAEPQNSAPREPDTSSDGSVLSEGALDEIEAAASEESGVQPQAIVETETLVDDAGSVNEDVVADGDDILVFSFSDDCWLEISDASGRVLIAELQEKGDNQRVFGQAPFEVMLGNARVATLTLNGEVVSIEPRPGRKTLRFTVPR